MSVGRARLDDDGEPASAREPDTRTRELPLDVPVEGVGADFLNDVTQIYLNEIGQNPAAHAGGGACLRARDARRRLRIAAEDDRAQPATGREHRQALPQSRPDPCRPDRGRQPRADSRPREVRPRARLPLHDLRHMVDPPVDRACDHEPVAHHPPARARGQGAQHRAARTAPPRNARHAGRKSRADARRRCAPARQAGRAGAQGSGLQRARHLARRAGGRRAGAVGR